MLLKRGMSSTIKELLMSAEYIVAHGNPNVILCERGIRTFETATRNTCDISAVPVLNELTHLPVVLDPSHATGKRSLVPALSRAGVADRRGRVDRRSAPLPGKGRQRRRAIAHHPAVPRHDEGPQAADRALECFANARGSGSRIASTRRTNLGLLRKRRNWDLHGACWGLIAKNLFSFL